MPTETPAVFTASAMAKTLGVADTKVKKAILELGLSPAAKKGCCTYYSAEALLKIKTTLK